VARQPKAALREPEPVSRIDPGIAARAAIARVRPLRMRDGETGRIFRMKLLHMGLALTGLAALAACGTNTPNQNAADNARMAAENQADAFENMADNTLGAAENRADALENQADAARDAGENRADALESRDTGPVPADTNGM